MTPPQPLLPLSAIEDRFHSPFVLVQPRPAPPTVAPQGADEPRRLRVRLTLEGDTYALRHAAKRAGYTFAAGAWHRELSTPLLGVGALALTQATGRLQAQVQAEAALFGGAVHGGAPTVW